MNDASRVGPERHRRTRRFGFGTALRHLLEYGLFRLLLALLVRLSWPSCARLGRTLGQVGDRWLRIRRGVTRSNLRASFPDWGEERVRATASAAYRSFGVTFVELARLSRARPEEVLSRVEFEDPERFRDLQRRGRGVVLYTGHLGNWEVVGSAIAALGHPIWVVVATQRNRRIDHFVRRTRERAGMGVIRAEEGLRPILRALRRNELVAFVADQDAGRDGEFVEFLGRPASSYLGPARFARLTGAPIQAGFAVRLADGRYRCELPPPIDVSTDLPEARAEQLALGQMSALLESVVRRYPEQWFWMHRRWKSRPTLKTETSKETP